MEIPVPDLVQNLAVCPECKKPHVHPVEWSEINPPGEYQEDSPLWTVLLRCVSCDTFREDIFTHDECSAFDEWLDDSQVELHVLWLNTVRSNMCEFVDNFLGALEADAITPMDF